MNSIETKSFKQVVKNEYKLIFIVLIMILFIPFLMSSLIISDILTFSNFSVIEKAMVVLGISKFNFTNIDVLAVLSVFTTLVCIPIIGILFARKLQGYRIKKCLLFLIKDIKRKRTWNYILKVYVPIFLITLFGGMLISNSVDQFAIKILESNLVLLVLILIALFSIFAVSLLDLLIIASIKYYSSNERIKNVIKNIPTRECNKVLILNFIQTSTIGFTAIMFFIFIIMLKPLTFISNLSTIIIVFMIVSMFYQFIFLYLKLNLYMNSASKIK